MYMRSVTKKANGKTFRYWRLVESVRTPRGPRQRIVANLGDLSSYSAADWATLAARMGNPAIARKLEQRVASPRRGRPPHFTLAATDTAEVALPIYPSTVALRKTRDFGDVFVGLQLWQRLGLGELFSAFPGCANGRIPLATVSAVVAINRLVAPKSELGMLDWLPRTALSELLGIELPRLTKERLYRALDAVVPHKARIEEHLARRGEEMFQRDYSFLLYDITSTYFEGRAVGNEQAKRGYSRDHRSDCLQVCLGLVVDRSGYPVGYELLPGNTVDNQTVVSMTQRLAARFGATATDRMLCMDRGMVTPDNLEHLRHAGYRYLLTDRRGESRHWWDKAVSDRWQILRQKTDHTVLVEVQEVGTEGNDRIILVRSAGCRQKERGIHQRLVDKLTEALEKLRMRVERKRLRDADKIERAIGAVLARHPGVNRWVTVTHDRAQHRVQWEFVTERETLARELEGLYVLRTNDLTLTAATAWEQYILLTRIENCFRQMKGDLSLRPVFHRLPRRVEAHILFSFLAYVMLWALEHTHRAKGGTLTGRRLLEYLHEIKLGTIGMMATSGHRLAFERICEPSREQQEILASMGIVLPKNITGATAITL